MKQKIELGNAKPDRLLVTGYRLQNRITGYITGYSKPSIHVELTHDSNVFRNPIVTILYWKLCGVIAIIAIRQKSGKLDMAMDQEDHVYT